MCTSAASIMTIIISHWHSIPTRTDKDQQLSSSILIHLISIDFTTTSSLTSRSSELTRLLLDITIHIERKTLSGGHQPSASDELLDRLHGCTFRPRFHGSSPSPTSSSAATSTSSRHFALSLCTLIHFIDSTFASRIDIFIRFPLCLRSSGGSSIPNSGDFPQL